MITHYLFLIALGWFIQEFEPFKMVINYVLSKLKPNDLLGYLANIFDCWQCATFWSAWIITQSFTDAVIASFLTYIIDLTYEAWMRKR